MRKIISERYQETYVEETLENGLHVVLWQKPDFEKSLFMMSTPLGAFDLKQIDENSNEHSFPAGIAHFLEHKMFEKGEEDVMDLFSKMGANVNAFTSYNETAYYFSTSNKEVEKPLCLLLDFVQSLDISKESVEKEKGIIVQELNMYKQMSDVRLLFETFTSLFSEHPLRYDIGGDEESVRSTTLEQLQECYKINYHPSKMILIGVSAQDPEKLMQIIKTNQNSKNFPEMHRIERMPYQEPKEVARENFSFQMDVSIPKLSIAYKLNGIEDPILRSKTEWGLKIMLDTYFSSLNPKFQQWLDDEIINDYVGSEIEFGKDYGLIMFYGETNKIDAFKGIVEEIVNEIKNGHVDDNVMERLKRRYFGQAIRSLNNFEDIAISYIRSCFAGMDFFTSIDVLYDIDSEFIKQVCKEMDFSNRSVVLLEPKK